MSALFGTATASATPAPATAASSAKTTSSATAAGTSTEGGTSGTSVAVLVNKKQEDTTTTTRRPQSSSTSSAGGGGHRVDSTDTSEIMPPVKQSVGNRSSSAETGAAAQQQASAQLSVVTGTSAATSSTNPQINLVTTTTAATAGTAQPHHTFRPEVRSSTVPSALPPRTVSDGYRLPSTTSGLASVRGPRPPGGSFLGSAFQSVSPNLLPAPNSTAATTSGGTAGTNGMISTTGTTSNATTATTSRASRGASTAGTTIERTASVTNASSRTSLLSTSPTPGAAATTSVIKTRPFANEQEGRRAAEAYYGSTGARNRRKYGAGCVDDLPLYKINEEFNPVSGGQATLVKRWLKIPEHATITRLEGLQGGLNLGVYSAEGSGMEAKALKVVKSGSRYPGILSEADNILHVRAEIPGILNDPQLTFPKEIIRVRHVPKAADGKPEELHVMLMRKARGRRLAEVLADAWRSPSLSLPRSKIFELFRQIGRFLKAFHLRYPEREHGDVQPSNIFYDEDNGFLTLIDVGGMGQKTMKSDREHFCESLRLLSQSYGPELLEHGRKAFEDGYRSQIGPDYRNMLMGGSLRAMTST
ncbi:unnamed protein product [Amoebophrya sp. A25]|nr:unnamed protein product [Amoebophrya sp. A25]|eukprot:GSA25T00021485001.1